ncbi:hypothetical protein NUKP40_00760 [Klebsiella variicola]|nr:hypothetical protein NUKP40_00760 [Klebsiella variicola]
MGPAQKTSSLFFIIAREPEGAFGYKGIDSESVIFRHQAGSTAQYITGALIGD